MTTRPTTTSGQTTGTSTTGGERTTEEFFGDYETIPLTVADPDGSVLGELRVAVADSGDERYRGLSDVEHLPEDAGMLFVYAGSGDRTFVMRRMSFGIDIVYVDPERRITEIHHAPAPEPDEDGNQQRYPGTGQYVLETNYRWTTEHGVTVGDRLSW